MTNGAVPARHQGSSQTVVATVTPMNPRTRKPDNHEILVRPLQNIHPFAFDTP
jgi:hypothetical protein